MKIKSILFLSFLTSLTQAASWECSAYCGYCELNMTDCKSIETPAAQLVNGKSSSLIQAFQTAEIECKSVIPKDTYVVLVKRPESGTSKIKGNAVIPADICRYTP